MGDSHEGWVAHAKIGTATNNSGKNLIVIAREFQIDIDSMFIEQALFHSYVEWQIEQEAFFPELGNRNFFVFYAFSANIR